MRSDDENAQDAGMAELQKSLARVVHSKRDKARKAQLAMFEVLSPLQSTTWKPCMARGSACQSCTWLARFYPETCREMNLPGASFAIFASLCF